METFLYAWNPNRWSWENLDKAIACVRRGEDFPMYWSCGPKSKAIGDAFFLVRLGIEPRGIIGFGYISSEPYDLPHWDPAQAQAGKIAARTDVRFKALSSEPFISIDDLQSDFPEQHWTPQQSGIRVTEAISARIMERCFPDF